MGIERAWGTKSVATKMLVRTGEVRGHLAHANLEGTPVNTGTGACPARVWSFVCRGTIETRPSEVQETKEKTFDDLVESMKKSDDGSEVRDLLSDPD